MSVVDIGTIHLPEVEGVDTDKPPAMTHLLDHVRGFPWTLCGARLGRLLDHIPPEEKVDCVVCESMWEERYRRWKEGS